MPFSLKHNRHSHALLLIHDPITILMECNYNKAAKINSDSNNGNSFAPNKLTRPILCKMISELTDDDLINAKELQDYLARTWMLLKCFMKNFNGETIAKQH